MWPLLQRAILEKKNIYVTAKVQESTAVSGKSKYLNRFLQPYRKYLGASAARQTLDLVMAAC